MEEIILYYTVLDSIKHSLLTLWGDFDSEFSSTGHYILTDFFIPFFQLSLLSNPSIFSLI